MGSFSEIDAMKQLVEQFDQDCEDFKQTLRRKATKGQRFVYNWQYRRLDGFEKKLGDLLFHADSGNQKKMLKAFPEEAQAVIDYQSVEGWWAECERDVEDYHASFK
jgi:hypothetical protein